MSVASQLEQLETDITNAYSAIDTKGGTIPAHKNTNNLATAINSISTGGGGGSINDYFEPAPDNNYNDARSLIKQMPTIDMTDIVGLDYMFEGFTSLTTAPTLTNLSAVGSALGMFMSCYALANVPNYYMPGCMDFSEMFTSCEELTDTSIDNIMQMCINGNNEDYTGIKALEYVIPNALCYRAENLTHYQDFLNAGWVLYESDISGDEPEEPEEPEE